MTRDATSSRAAVIRWFTGVLTGTLIIAVTSPLFVRSYVPRTYSDLRGVVTLQPGSQYRWRAEGYATTTIGQHGVVGDSKAEFSSDASFHIAFWGDSQAEGVCVRDDQKIHALIETTSRGGIDALCFAASGDDCNTWLAQLTSVEGQLAIDAHVFLVVELDDWSQPVAEYQRPDSTSMNWAAERLPAFVVQAARNVMTTGSDNAPRRLRFSPGPIRKKPDSATAVVARSGAEGADPFDQQLERLRESATVPCLFVYAPKTPSIQSGSVVRDDGDSDRFDLFRDSATARGFQVLDLREALRDEVDSGNWPRGFHNGQFGVGHFNAWGNRLIAESIDRAVTQLVEN